MATHMQVITDNLDLWTSALLTRSTAGRGSNGRVEAYGIKKLRELILELAVRGELIPTEGNWEQTCLGNLGEWAVGSGFPTSEQGHEGLEILFAKVSDMNLPENTKFIITTNHTISEETAIKLRVNVHSAGTVVFPKIGGAIATNKRRILSRPTAIDNNCLGITPTTGVSTDWLYLVLTSIDFTKYQAGTSVPALSQGVLAKIPSMLPPLAEQHRIVAKVDELMALCDQLEQQQTNSIEAHQTLVETLLGTLTNVASQQELNEAWTRIADHFATLFTTEQSIDQLKQTILQLAVMGKLVPQDPGDEPASVLLDKIAGEKKRLIKEGKMKKQSPLPEIVDDEEPFNLPTGWAWMRFGEIGEIIGGGTPSKSNLRYWSGLIPWVSPKDMKVDFISESIDTISEEAVEESAVKLIPAGSLLIVVRGMILAHSFPVAITRVPVTVNQDMKAVVIDGFDKSYVLLVAKALKNDFVSMVDRSSHGTCKLVSEKLWAKVLPIPPLAEQHRIVAKVNELMTLCDSLKARLAAAQITQIHLADTIVEQAVA